VDETYVRLQRQASTVVFARGHALIENLRQGFSRLTAPLAAPVRLAQGLVAARPMRI
jgi:hypothetical protein